MATRIVTGTFSKADGTPLSGKAVKFTLKKGTYSSTNQYPKNPTISGRTNATGALKAADGLADLLLWVDAEAVDPTPYVCTLGVNADKETFEFTIPVGTTPIDLSILRANGPAVPPANSTLQFLVDTHAAVKASATVLGHVKVGARLTMDPTTGILSADVQTQDLSGYATTTSLTAEQTARINADAALQALVDANTTAIGTKLTQSQVDARIKLLQKWALNFTGNGDVYIPAYEAMTVDAGTTAIGTGTIVYAKSTTAAPSTFNTTTLPATLEAGAWLKVTVSAISGFKALELRRTA